jgi:excisionase family DNA binding protein
MFTFNGTSMDLLTIAETARLLKVNPMTVRRYIKSGRLPAVRFGRRVRVRKESLDHRLRPVTPREGDAAREGGGRMREIERPAVPRLTDEKQRGVLGAIEQAKRERAELAATYREVPVPSTLELLDEAREQRAREFS